MEFMTCVNQVLGDLKNVSRVASDDDTYYGFITGFCTWFIPYFTIITERVIYSFEKKSASFKANAKSNPKQSFNIVN